MLPPELVNEFQELKANLSSDEYTDASLLADWSIERRRALGYVFADGLRPQDWNHSEFELISFPGIAGSADDSVEEIAEQLGFVVAEELYLEPSQKTFYRLTVPTELSLGEAAWYIDWMISNYSTKIMYANPSFLLST